MAAEDYTGHSDDRRRAGPYAGPLYQATTPRR